MALLQNTVYFLQASTSQLTAEIEALKEKRHHENLLQEQLLNQEKEKLTLRLNEMQAKILDQQNSIAALYDEYERVKQESKCHQEQVSALSSQLHEREKEINNLKEELDEERVQQQEDKTREQRQDFTAVMGNGVGEKSVASGSSCEERIEMGISAKLDTLKAENSSLKDLKLLLEAKIQNMEREIEAKSGDERVQVLQQENVKSSQQLENLKGCMIEVCTMTVG